MAEDCQGAASPVANPPSRAHTVVRIERVGIRLGEVAKIPLVRVGMGNVAKTNAEILEICEDVQTPASNFGLKWWKRVVEGKWCPGLR